MSHGLLFGGAFNPPTNAHIDLADHARKATGSDFVIFMPSQMSYIENDQGKNFAFTDRERYEMLQKIAMTKEWMIVSPYELFEEAQPRTYITLKHLKETGYDCSLLFGSDKLPELENGWRFVEEIAHEFGIVCMERSGDDCEKIINEDPYLHTLKEHIRLIDTPDTYHHISSTAVRTLFVEKKYDEIEKLIPEELNGLREYERNL